MRYDNDNDCLFGYENMMNSGFDDLLENEDYENDLEDEWVNSYNTLENEIIDE
jgi:hypothetical protein